MAADLSTIKYSADQILKGASDNTIRSRLLLAMMKKYGRIIMHKGGAGKSLNWTVQRSLPAYQAYGSGQPIVFSPQLLYESLQLDWRGYKAADMMTDKEYKTNGDDYAIIDRYADVIPKLVEGLTAGMGTELLIDGNAAGNDDRYHGIESFFGTGTTVDADIIAQPSDTYGGLATTLADKGGTWSSLLTTPPNAAVATDWPDGKGSPEYDYNAPRMANWSADTGWGTASGAWLDNCIVVARRMHTWMRLGGGKENVATMCTMAGHMFDDFQAALESRFRVLTPYREGEELGFQDAITFNGVGYQPDFDVPANTAYWWNVYQMVLEILGEDLFESHGPEFDIKSDSYLWTVGNFGNLRFNPKYFGKAYNYA